MLDPGYYLVTKNTVLQRDFGTRRLRLTRGDWLVTNGVSIGRFDAEENLDWTPLQWQPGHMMLLDEPLSAQVEGAVVRVPFGQLERRFHDLVDVGDGAPVPEMPRPTLQEGLGAYLRARRNYLM